MPTIGDVTYTKAEVEGFIQQMAANVIWKPPLVVTMTPEGVVLEKSATISLRDTAEIIGKFDEMARSEVADGKRVEIVRVTKEWVKVRFVEREEGKDEPASAPPHSG